MMYSKKYYEKLLKYKSDKIIPGNENYYENVGTKFELQVNDELMTLPEFVLYWKIGIKLAENVEVKWSITGNFFNNNNADYSFCIAKQFEPDHILITPYAVFIFESKCYSSRCYYHKDEIYGGVFSKDNDGKECCYRDPEMQVKIYESLMKEILQIYEVDLPVISKVLFKYRMPPESVYRRKPENIFFFDDGIRNMVLNEQINLQKKTDQALKLLQSLWFDKCQPIAYDNNVNAWSN